LILFPRAIAWISFLLEFLANAVTLAIWTVRQLFQ
jgi:hypothetical protein